MTKTSQDDNGKCVSIVNCLQNAYVYQLSGMTLTIFQGPQCQCKDILQFLQLPA